MKKLSILLCGLLIILAVPSLFAVGEGVKFTIRFYNQQIAYPDSKIPIKVEIENDTAQTYRFKLADSHVFNLDFSVKSLTNVAVQQSANFIMQRNTNQPVFFRDVSLDPGDQYAFIEDLSNYVKLPGSGVYLIQGLFYPNLYTDASSPALTSNTLVLDVRPGTTPAIQAAIEQATAQVLQQEALSPDQVVAYLLHARQKGDWDKFFLYLDVKNLMLEQPAMRRRYDRASDQQRHDMIAAFKQSLEQQTTDGDILLVPTSFTIEKTSYTPTEGTVLVKEEFAHATYTDVREYTYYLHRSQNVWLIYNYTVRNLGTQ